MNRSSSASRQGHFGYLMIRNSSLLLAIGSLLLVGCSKPKEDAPVPAASAGAAVNAATPAASANSSASPARSAEAPSSFADGAKQEIENSPYLNCEGKTKSGWLEVLCRKKSASGGHPKSVFRGEERETPLAEADESGELRLVVPFDATTTDRLAFEWTDVSYDLAIDKGTAKFGWTANTLEYRRACAALQEESQARLKEAQNVARPDALKAGELGKSLRFGGCQQVGRGAFALGLRRADASGSGAERFVTVELDLVSVQSDGQTARANFGTLKIPPAALATSRIVAFDYDDDGNDEALVLWDIVKGPITSEPPVLAAIWSSKDGKVTPFEHQPTDTAAGVFLEQLDPDLRPDLATFGPFVAFLSDICGAKKCPPRLTGPKFYLHSLQGGSFDGSDAVVKSALERACGKKQGPVVAMGESGPHLERTAHSVACARARGIPTETIQGELASAKAGLCGTNENCPAFEALGRFAQANAPTTFP